MSWLKFVDDLLHAKQQLSLIELFVFQKIKNKNKYNKKRCV